MPASDTTCSPPTRPSACLGAACGHDRVCNEPCKQAYDKAVGEQSGALSLRCHGEQQGRPPSATPGCSAATWRGLAGPPRAGSELPVPASHPGRHPVLIQRQPDKPDQQAQREHSAIAEYRLESTLMSVHVAEGSV